jgi:uncharacterized protein (TIGR03437 family)
MHFSTFQTARRIAALLFVLTLSPFAHAYIQSILTFSDGSSVAIRRADVTALQYFISSKAVAGVVNTSGAVVISAGSNPVAAARASLAVWSGLPSSKVKFLPLKVTDKAIDSGDGQNTIAVGTTPGDISAVGGALAVTVNTAVSFAAGSTPSGDVSDADIILTPAFAFSTDGSTPFDLQAVITHELGHSLGLSHSELLGATMYPYQTPAGRILSSDEIGFATSVYPAPDAKFGTLTGKVVLSDGSPVQTGLITVFDTVTGVAQGTFTAQDGTWSQQLPPGAYAVIAEPMGPNSPVQPGNFYLTTATKVTTNFQATVLGGAATPTKVAVAADGTAKTSDLTVTAGSSPLTAPFMGVGPAGGSGDIGNVNQGRLIFVNSGKALDIGLVGGGIDGTVSIQAFGPGVSVRAGSVRVDTRVNFGGSLAGLPFVRLTLDVAKTEKSGLMSLFIARGSNTFVLSGQFLVVPPKPVFSSKSVVNAASGLGANGDGVVSPGGIYSIYSGEALTLGPAAFVQPAGYDPYGSLATTLGGVTVTFDGVPAPLYLAYGDQLNLQVPFEVAGKTSTKVVVNFQGSQSDAITVPVVRAQPAFFAAPSLGLDLITQNFPDYSLNKPDNPIARGGIVLMYGTGLGPLSYALGTGQPGIAPPAGFPNAHTCSFGGKTASAFTYWNFGFVGEALWVVTVPADAPAGPAKVTCTDTATGATTPSGTVYIK